MKIELSTQELQVLVTLINTVRVTLNEAPGLYQLREKLIQSLSQEQADKKE